MLDVISHFLSQSKLLTGGVSMPSSVGQEGAVQLLKTLLELQLQRRSLQIILGNKLNNSRQSHPRPEDKTLTAPLCRDHLKRK